MSIREPGRVRFLASGNHTRVVCGRRRGVNGGRAAGWLVARGSPREAWRRAALALDPGPSDRLRPGRAPAGAATRTNGTRLWAAWLVLLVLVGCGPADEGIPISLGSQSSVGSEKPEETRALRVGIGAMISPTATFELYGEVVAQLGTEMGRRGVAVQRRSYGEMNDLVEQRRVDCALVCTGAYLAGRRKFGMEALVVPAFEGTPTYHSIVIVREDSGIESFEQLRGKRFAFVDPISNTGRLYPVSRILSLGFPTEEFFDYEYTGTHDASIDAVRAGVVDGAAVDHLIFDYLGDSDPKRVRGLRIIEKSPAYGAPPVVVHPSMDSATRERLRSAFVSLAARDTGRTALKRLRIDGFVRPPKGLYDNVAALEAKVRRNETGKLRR